jgi:hypothetical protein
MSEQDEEAREDILRISSSARSTARMVQLLRLAADLYPSACGTLDLAADRIEGIAAKTGPAGKNDDAALRMIAELRPRLGAMTVAFVGRKIFPCDEAAQDAAQRRWRRKMKQFRTS